MKSKKAIEIERVLGTELMNERKDLEALEEEWKAFFLQPYKYAGTCVVDMVNLWYAELHAEAPFEEDVAEDEYVWEVYVSSGMGTVRYLTSFPDEIQAEEFCERNGWKWRDENDLVWNMSYEERGGGKKINRKNT